MDNMGKLLVTVFAFAPAAQVHYKKYARWNIGKEPIEWLVSVCKSCLESMHSKALLFIRKK